MSSVKKRRTLKDAEQELAETRKLLQSAKAKLITTARENARLKVLLEKYLEHDDSLLSTSQLTDISNSQTSTNLTLSQTSFDEEENGEHGKDSASEARATGSPSVGLSDTTSEEFLLDENDKPMSQLSQLSSTSNLDAIMEFLDQQEKDAANEPYTFRKIGVGVGVLLTSSSFPDCVLAGIRKSSHGEGRYALPGGHLEMYETWEECAQREVEEETGLQIEAPSFFHVSNDIMHDDAKHYITIFMHAAVPSEMEPQNMEPEKCEGWEWIPWSKIQASSSLFVPLKNLVDTGFTPSSLL